MNAAIILSRTDSTRLPGKALLKIKNKTLLEWCIESLKGESNYKIIVATTKRKIDNTIVEIAQKNNVNFFRGDKNNVAKRVLDCANSYNLSAFARVNGDSPFIRKKLIIKAFNKIQESNFDFVTNLVPRHFPYGISVEVFKTKTYEDAYKSLETDEQKEHVTTYFYENMSKYKPYFLTYMDGHENDHNIR
ncbi:MAG: hypothetical protein K9L78_03360, partial [Victivallales bacterium]|nr:hypothetical protein [Victivallales bacterium]